MQEVLPDKIIKILGDNIFSDINSQKIFSALIDGPLNFTQIVTKTGLSYNITQRTLPKLEGALFIVSHDGPGRSITYQLTPTGERCVEMTKVKK